MKTFRLKVLETEEYERHYIIEAETEEDAKEKYYNDDDFEIKPVINKIYDRNLLIDSVKELEEYDYCNNCCEEIKQEEVTEGVFGCGECQRTDTIEIRYREKGE